MSPGMLIFWSGGSWRSKMWFPRTMQSIKTVEIMNLDVTLLPSLMIAFLMSFPQKKKKSPNNVFLLLFSSSALLQHVGIPHTFLSLTQTPGRESQRDGPGRELQRLQPGSAALSAAVPPTFGRGKGRHRDAGLPFSAIPSPVHHALWKGA